jgi:hypothetical protein
MKRFDPQNRASPSAVRRVSSLLAAATALLFVLALVACTSASAPTSSPVPSPSPAASTVPLPSVLPSPLPSPSGSPPATGLVRLDISLVAGPTCPVERVPPDPSCAPRPVPGAAIDVRDASGKVVAQLTSDAQGHATADLPPGSYVVVGMPVAGVMGSPEPQTVQLSDPASGMVTLMYDTGIR